MQYLVVEVQGKASAATGDAKVFDEIDGVIKYLQKLNKNKRLLVGESEINTEMLQRLLKERLSTVSVFEQESRRRWSVSAF